MHKNGVLRKRSVHIPRSLCGPWPAFRPSHGLGRNQ
jgi:hypothetical protein